MKSEADPVTHDESVLRMVWHEHFKPDCDPKVRPSAIEPKGKKARSPEVKGISVWREACLDAPTDPLQTIKEDKRGRYYIARLGVSDLVVLGLSVVPDPRSESPAIPGHALIPELNCNDYQADKVRWEPVLQRLAELASADIVHEATDLG